MFQSLFYWITYSYEEKFNDKSFKSRFQSLFYWITYSYSLTSAPTVQAQEGFNPYFTGLPILMIELDYVSLDDVLSFNPYFTGLPILITSASTMG